MINWFLLLKSAKFKSLSYRELINSVFDVLLSFFQYLDIFASLDNKFNTFISHVANLLADILGIKALRII